MSRLTRLSQRDLGSLSAYADDALSPAEKQALEQRLELEPVLRQALQEIRATSAILRKLPEARPPRSFALTPEMAGIRTGWLRAPLLQLATALAMIAFIVTVGVDVFAGPLQAGALRAAAPAQGMLAEAPAESAAADAMQAGAAAPAVETAAVERSAAEATPVGAAAPAQVPTATLTAPVPAGVANLEAATAASAAALAPSGGGTPAPVLGAAATSKECEACGEEMVAPTQMALDKIAGTGVPAEAAATQPFEARGMGPGAETPAATPVEGAAPGQVETLVEGPAPATTPRTGLPALRWMEIGLGSAALALGALTVWARRRAR